MTAARLLGFRVVVALAQGAALYGLADAVTGRDGWPATWPGLFAALLMTAVFAPFVAHIAAGAVAEGAMSRRAMLLWLALAGAVAAALGAFAVARGALPNWSGTRSPWPEFRLFAAVAAALFIAHVRVVDCLAECRFLPSYTRHFDTAWKLALQLGLAVAFLGVFWLILYLADALFALVGVKLWEPVFGRGWFAWPASALAVGLALHATDVQPALIRGVRTVGLVLFAWLLPLLVLVIGGFLVTLAVVGIAPLWATGRASAIVLSACAALVLLVNAAYQDGTGARARLQHLSLHAGALLALPLVVIAAWALGLRVAQHGWTAERIVAGAVALLAATYGLGYALAALRPGLRGFRATNHIAAHLAVALILALSTPLADPARLMVASQVARLESGAVPPERFDFLALRLDGARWGTDALRRMVAENRPGIASAASDALMAMDGSARHNRRRPGEDPASRFTLFPPGTPMPEGLVAYLSGDSQAARQCLVGRRATNCVIRPLRLPGEAAEAVIVDDTRYSARLLIRRPDGSWHDAAQVFPASGWCGGRHDGWITREALDFAPPVFPDLMAGTTRLRINPVGEACDR